MSTLASHALALLAGALLGAAFFRGLWITLRGLPASRRPALRMLVSLLLRLTLVVAVFFMLSRYSEWSHLVMAAIGFAILRAIIMQRMTRHRATRGQTA